MKKRINFTRGVFQNEAPRYGVKKDPAKRVVIIVAALCLLLAFWSVYMLLSLQSTYSAAGNYYSDLASEASPIKNQKSSMTEEDFLSIGRDIVGWITFPDTRIDYPVAQCDNNSYYCYHLPDGTYNACGTVFMDFTKRADLSCVNTVLYGHHMKNGAMFANLNEYKDESYYSSHKTAYYYTSGGDYEIQLAYGFLISSEQWRSGGFSKDENIAALLSFAKDNTTFTSGVQISASDKIMTFSTCSYEYGDANYMIIGKVVPIYE